jgi:hypothetical protein
MSNNLKETEETITKAVVRLIMEYMDAHMAMNCAATEHKETMSNNLKETEESEETITYEIKAVLGIIVITFSFVISRVARICYRIWCNLLN